MTEIWDRIRSLNLDDKERLFSRLKKEIEEEKRLERDGDLKVLIDRICKIMLIDFYQPRSREHIDVVSRIIIANFLLYKGYSLEKIGAVMKKHHATIMYYKKSFDNWIELPKYYEEELGYWNKVLNEI